MIDKTKNNEIIVALAADDKYMAPVLVSVKSIIKFSNRCYDYKIYILSSKRLGSVVRRSFRSLVRNKTNVSIVFITTGNIADSLKLSDDGFVKGVTRATYYRLFLPVLLPNDDKVLYIDADTIAVRDVALIYCNNIDDYYIGGVNDIFSLNDSKQYINAGVLLMNLCRFREEKLTEKMTELASVRTFPYNDQDIINLVCNGKIKELPYNCNVIVDYLNKNIEDLDKVYSDPIIYHFAGKTKPWYYPTSDLCSDWWEIANTFRGTDKLVFRYYYHKLIAGNL